MRVAVKLLEREYSANDVVCSKFLGEAYLANSVKHPGIIQIHDDGVTDDGCAFLIMDLLQGQTLEALRHARGGRLELVEFFDIADKLMSALQAVHAADVVHGDIKPQNIFVCVDTSLRILDFGVARLVSQGAERDAGMNSLWGGSPSFMAPEQAIGAGNLVSARSDIWSLGATFFTVLTGETVHCAGTVEEKLMAARTQHARSIRSVRPDLPVGLASVIDVALRFDSALRWASVSAMREAMRRARELLSAGAAASEAASGVLSGALQSRDVRRSRPQRRLWAVGTIAVGAFFATWLVMMSKPSVARLVCTKQLKISALCNLFGDSTRTDGAWDAGDIAQQEETPMDEPRKIQSREDGTLEFAGAAAGTDIEFDFVSVDYAARRAGELAQRDASVEMPNSARVSSDEHASHADRPRLPGVKTLPPRAPREVLPSSDGLEDGAAFDARK